MKGKDGVLAEHHTAYVASIGARCTQAVLSMLFGGGSLSHPNQTIMTFHTRTVSVSLSSCGFPIHPPGVPSFAFFSL